MHVKDDAINLACSLTNNLFKQGDPKLGIRCTLNDGIGHRIGDFGITFKSGNGNNIDINVSKDLLVNLVMDGLNLDNVLEKLFS